MKWFILLFFSSNLFAANLKLTRPCAAHLEPWQRAEQLYHTGEMSFDLTIDGLSPKEDLELRIELTPADGVGRHITRDYTFRPSSKFWLPRSNIRRDGSLNYRMRSPFDRALKKAQKKGEGTIWNIRVGYVQANAKISGTMQTTFVFAPKQRDFYQVQDTPFCQTLSAPVVRGEIIRNHSNVNMTVTREQSSQVHFMNNLGFTLGPNQNTGSSIFLSPRSGAQMWLFADWSIGHGGNIDHARSRTWTLSPYENALFAERTTTWWTPTTRWQTKDISRDDEYSCTVVTAIDGGWMALDRVQDGLYVVPESVVDRPNQAQDFVTRSFPKLSSCGDARAGQVISRFKIEDGATATFYKTFSSFGENQ